MNNARDTVSVRRGMLQRARPEPDLTYTANLTRAEMQAFADRVNTNIHREPAVLVLRDDGCRYGGFGEICGHVTSAGFDMDHNFRVTLALNATGAKAAVTHQCIEPLVTLTFMTPSVPVIVTRRLEAVYLVKESAPEHHDPLCRLDPAAVNGC
jgi:hypothetical protein